MCATFKGHWTISAYTRFRFPFRFATQGWELRLSPDTIWAPSISFDNRGHCALSSSLWNWELSNCMETQLFCVFTLSVCGCECVWLCVSAPAIIIIDRISICCAFFMPRLQWNPFGAASSGGVNDNCAASCGRIGYIVDDFTNALNDIALPFASQSASEEREPSLAYPNICSNGSSLMHMKW